MYTIFNIQKVVVMFLSTDWKFGLLVVIDYIGMQVDLKHGGYVSIVTPLANQRSSTLANNRGSVVDPLGIFVLRGRYGIIKYSINAKTHGSRNRRR